MSFRGNAVATRGGNDPIDAQRYATQRVLSPEDLAQPLYDRGNYAAAGTSQLAFFSQQLGQTATLVSTGLTTAGTGASASKSKSYRDTNMDNAGVVPTKRFTFTGVAINYIPASMSCDATNGSVVGNIGSDIATLKNGGYLEFRIVDKPLLYLPLNLIPESNPVNSVSTAISSTTSFSTGQVAGIPYPMFKFAIPITLNPYENFRFICTFDGSPKLSQTYDIQVVLFAFMRRPS